MRVAVLAVVMATLSGCASASDVASRGKVVLAATDPDKIGYCPAELIAKARAEVAFARAAAQRGEPIAAKRHLDEAERISARIVDERERCITVVREPDPGTAKLDGDGDGVEDALDRCLQEREDLDGFVDNDGCPDVDDDGDGLSDVIDKCPREPEDLDGFEDLDGCPEAGP